MGLVLTLKAGDKVAIGEDIIIELRQYKAKQIRLKFHCKPDLKINRVIEKKDGPEIDRMGIDLSEPPKSEVLMKKRTRTLIVSDEIPAPLILT